MELFGGGESRERRGMLYVSSLALPGRVANFWQNFSARSTKKLGRWRKSSAPQKYSHRV
jgi:hypothetical protein